MKIALVTTDNREHFQEYANPHPYFGTAPQALLDGFAMLPDEVEVHVISCLRQSIPSPSKLAPNIWYHPLVVPKLGWMRTLYQGCIRAVRHTVREIDPDLVHGQGTERDCAISAVYSGRPNVVTIHGNMGLIAKVNHAKPFSYQWLNAYLEAWTLPSTAGVVCITRYTQEAVHLLARRTWLLPNAVDASFYDVTRVPEDPPVVLCVGLVCPRKNQNCFIRALDSLAAQHRFRVVFLGHIPDDAYGAEFRALLAVRSWCEHGGWADRAALRTWFARASLVALPSLEDNCPMVVLEGMAAGVPVVAARVGGVPDLIEEDVTGLFCDPLDGRSIAGAIERMLMEPDRASRMAECARARAMQRFHPREIASAHLDIYRDVLRTGS